MPSSERSPLIGENGQVQQTEPFIHRVFHAIQGRNSEPGWLRSFKFFFFESYFNIFLAFIPLGAVAHFLNWDAGLRFAFNFIAIIPLARLLGVATDQLSIPLGEAWAGLLNATVGNAVEIIVGLAALFQDQLRIVQTSLIGSVLSNMLLVLGCSFIAGGLNTEIQEFSSTGAQISSSLMTLAAIAIVLPAAFYHSQYPMHKPLSTNDDLMFTGITAPTKSTQHGLEVISHGTAVLLLVVYLAYLLFELKTHAYVFKSPNTQTEVEEAKMGVSPAAVGLVAATVMTAFSADWLVASIEETADKYDIPKGFIGMILLPIVANAAEHVTSVWMAAKGKMEMPLGICVGSSIQIITFVIPLLVVIGWASGHALTLYFADFETIALFLSVLLVNTLIMDGKTHYMEGLILLILYIIIAICYWVTRE